jgi:hypothetical protein
MQQRPAFARRFTQGVILTAGRKGTFVRQDATREERS